MKIVISTAILLSVTLLGNSQKVSSEHDKFTKQNRVQTEHIWLYKKLTDALGISIRSVDSSIFISLDGFGAGTDIIGNKDRAIFLCSDDSTVSAYSTGIQSYKIGTGSIKGSFEHQYRIELSDLMILANKPAVAIRKYGADGYSNLGVPAKNRNDLQKLCGAFIEEYNKKK